VATIVVLSGLLYYITSAPTITWIHESQDSGELSACASTLGISHPTGYPLYMLIGWVHIHITPWLEPARSMVLFSVVTSAVAMGVIARGASAAIRLAWGKEAVSDVAAGWWGALAAIFCVINPLTWSQAVVCEVYSLALLLQALVWLYLIKYIQQADSGNERGKLKALLTVGFIFGLVLSHHLVGGSVILAVAIILIACPPKKPVMTLLKAGLMAIPGLLLYLYLPIRSMVNPRLDWGNPENVTNFINHVTGLQYRMLVMGVTWEEFSRRVGTLRWEEYWGILPVVLFLAGLVAYVSRPKGSATKALPLAFMLYITWVIVFACGYMVSDYEVFLYPLTAVIALGTGPGFVLLSKWLGRVHKYLPSLVVIVALITVIGAVNGRYVDMDASNPELNSAGTFAYRALSEVPDGSLIIAATDGHLFSLMYGINCGITHPVTGVHAGPRKDVDLVGYTWVMRDWFRENVRDRFGEDGRLRFNPSSREIDIALGELVDQNMDHRPVYVDGMVLRMLQGGPGKYEVSPTIALFQIRNFELVTGE